MKASFGQRDVPLFLSLASRYAPVSELELARKALKVIAFGFNQENINDETFKSNITALSKLLNIIVQKLTIESSCTFFKNNSIEFGMLPSYEHALTYLTAFLENKDKKEQYTDQIEKFLTKDLFYIVTIIVNCKPLIKVRDDKTETTKEVKKPSLKEIGTYTYLFVGKSRSALLKDQSNAPVIQAYRILKKALRLDSISEEDFNNLHSMMENILIDGWGYYYKRIKIAYSKVDHNVRYTTILSKLEIVGHNIINVALIGRHNRQVAAIDIKHNFDNELHRKMMFELQGFLCNIYCLFLAYNYLVNRIIKGPEVVKDEPENQVIHTWTCGFCNKKFGNTKPITIDHTIMITDAIGNPQKAICPGRQHPPVEIGDSGLRIKSEAEKARYENAILELNALDTATTLMVMGKYTNRVFTPKDLSWNDRLNKAKAEKKAAVDKLKIVQEITEQQIAQWKPLPLEMVPVWTGSKKKVA